MKIQFEIPDVKFEPGDFIRYTETGSLTGLLVIARIQYISFEGSWYYDGKKPSVSVEECYYMVIVQEGSLTTEKTPLRPGILLTCPMEDIHTYARKVKYKCKFWEGDTLDNWVERDRVWKSKENEK